MFLFRKLASAPARARRTSAGTSATGATTPAAPQQERPPLAHGVVIFRLFFGIGPRMRSPSASPAPGFAATIRGAAVATVESKPPDDNWIMSSSVSRGFSEASARSHQRMRVDPVLHRVPSRADPRRSHQRAALVEAEGAPVRVHALS